MTANHRRLKVITLDLDGDNYECQVKTWNVANNTGDGEQMYTFCPTGVFRESADDDYALELTFFADWTTTGISDFLTANDGEDVTFQLDHHPDIVGEHVRWAGTVRVKAPSVGGDYGVTEESQVTLQCIGKPVYSRP